MKTVCDQCQKYMQDIPERRINQAYFTEEVIIEMNFKEDLRVHQLKKMLGKTFRAKGAA